MIVHRSQFIILQFTILLLQIFIFLIQLHAMVLLEVGENAVVQAMGLMSKVKIFFSWQFFGLVEGVFKCYFIIYH